MDRISLLIIDDHPLFRQGVVDALSLEPDFKVVGQAANGEEALELMRIHSPDVAILDINLPGMNGQQVVRQALLEKLSTRIMLLTGYDDDEQAIHAIMAGAFGYCSKDIQPQQLLELVREINKENYVIGEQVLTRSEIDRWLKNQMEKAHRPYSEPGSPFHPLSAREMEVLICVVRGMSNKEIAAVLGISHQTVKNHVTSILRKFGVDDRTQAVVYALKRGWVNLNDDIDTSGAQE